MKNDTLDETDCLIYPGAYTPLLNEEEVQSALISSHKSEMVLPPPPVNVTELHDVFKVEVSVPGVNREDFLVLADENILSIYAVHKECGLHEGEKFQLHEFNCEIFDRHVILPDNADSEFVSAEYKAGILRLYVPKTHRPPKNQHTRIVVY